METRLDSVDSKLDKVEVKKLDDLISSFANQRRNRSVKNISFSKSGQRKTCHS